MSVANDNFLLEKTISEVRDIYDFMRNQLKQMVNSFISTKDTSTGIIIIHLPTVISAFGTLLTALEEERHGIVAARS